MIKIIAEIYKKATGVSGAGDYAEAVKKNVGIIFDSIRSLLQQMKKIFNYFRGVSNYTNDEIMDMENPDHFRALALRRSKPEVTPNSRILLAQLGWLETQNEEMFKQAHNVARVSARARAHPLRVAKLQSRAYAISNRLHRTEQGASRARWAASLSAKKILKVDPKHKFYDVSEGSISEGSIGFFAALIGGFLPIRVESCSGADFIGEVPGEIDEEDYISPGTVPARKEEYNRQSLMLM